MIGVHSCVPSTTGEVLVPAEESVCKYWQHLPEATWSDDGKVLQLVQGTHFMGEEEFGNQLMLRACYSDFEDMLKEHFRRCGKGFAVIGNPGEQ
jgi:hypothetical protein